MQATRLLVISAVFLAACGDAPSAGSEGLSSGGCSEPLLVGLTPPPALAACLQLSLAGPHLGPGSPSAPPPMTLSAFGMNLHAATTADGRDRKQLERICRYLLRPPFAHDAVTALPGGRVRVSFKAPWRSGTAHADMDAHQFLARVCALA